MKRHYTMQELEDQFYISLKVSLNQYAINELLVPTCEWSVCTNCSVVKSVKRAPKKYQPEKLFWSREEQQEYKKQVNGWLGDVVGQRNFKLIRGGLWT
jgi:hypothetical protein